ncbi:hypothetical protein XI06_02700 [Bradyrhizobium sp. CCBAU 11434]|uniref:hypothetical protein n=1 Tax=Bradyrhizobium sp. CCBAU 11434 TaxID=1630885 RepID=UPI002304F0AE|nr:hypothetical protein [Bradyrhizobium sp. CCBAU 11434]MDA9519283.1 hypothetical protein [Bradyrhizobium sp. CCBAU 11434]
MTSHPYSYDHLPVIDYPNHPAYGTAFPEPSLGERAAALAKFASGLAIITARLMADYEHLPRPKDKSHKVAELVRRSPTYLRLVATQKLRRLTRRPAEPRTTAGANVLKTLNREGIAGLRLSAEQLAQVRDLLAPHYRTLEARLAKKTPDQRHFDETRLWLDKDVFPEIYAYFNQLGSELGVIDAASAYLDRPVAIAHVVPQINDPSDAFWANHFRDVGVVDSPCDYCHVDATYNLLKFIIYVSEVGSDNGPFTYVRGTHRASRNFWDGLIRRANDYAGLSSTKPQNRRLFNALPKFLQRKAAFGVDLPAGSEYADAILDNEWRVTSDQGDAVLFDPFGIHRGGMVRSGRRLVVTMMLTEPT